MQAPWNLKERFRGFMPVAVDVETSGIDPQAHALLEISAVLFAVGATASWRLPSTSGCT